ncbi:DUF5615 family PIN-like protein [Pandoraea sp. ISTKB]|uniref:DUF5615 family PIN-like protein n=1 Tax=Pandoraea sp. ISTKB TaxID=1586708 RepID=UPI0008475ECC|nr:DUF5615 family PIN-like protein [Pandoraea sp. ISTKB]ODP35013.1 hypothetical protein A9762_11650 [Pandoraea sp. ISTKB]
MARWVPIVSTDGEIKLFTKQFRQKARFLVDENMGEEVAKLLRSFGYSAIFVADVGLSGKSDETVFSYAWKKRLIILTHDSDFLDDQAFPFHRNPGVIVLPGAEGDGKLEPALADVIRLVAPYGKSDAGEKISVSVDRVWTLRRFDRDIGKHVTWRVRLTGSSGAEQLVDDQ